MLVIASLALLTAGTANASQMALDPQNRLHLGVNFVDGSVGLTGGFDSRLTRLVAVDIGGFVSPLAVADETPFEEHTPLPEMTFLRHGIYAAPGLRLPHAQPRTWAWELFARAGGGVIWVANLDPNLQPGENSEHAVITDIAGLVGADALIRFGQFGIRASGKAWMFEQIQTSPIQSFFFVRPQIGIEALLQW